MITKHWSLMTAEQKICANTGSFRDIEGNPQSIAPMRILSSEIHRSESC